MKININQIYYSHKSSTCMNKDGKALSVYESYQEAQRSAHYIGKSFIPYLCSTCGKYHLKPEEFYCEKINRICNCVDHNGKPKDSYKTESDAQKMAKIRSASGIELFVYKCPFGCGYHLTSNKILF